MFSCILIGSPRLHRWQWPWASLLPKNCQVPPAVLGSQGRTSSLCFGASSFLGSQPRKRAKRHTDMSTSVALEMVVRQLTSAMYCHHRPGGLKVANKTCVKCWRHYQALGGYRRGTCTSLKIIPADLLHTRDHYIQSAALVTWWILYLLTISF